MIKRLRKLIFNKRWYDIWANNDRGDGWGKESNRIIDIAKKMGIRIGRFQAQGNCFLGVYCSEDEIKKLIKNLGEADYSYNKSCGFNASLYRKGMIYKWM